MICCYHTEAKGQMCKEIIPIFLCIALLLPFTLPEIGDYTLLESLSTGFRILLPLYAGPALCVK